jgi:1-acyl-sn-glycerol-3-phosphate acyltransferase
MKVPVLGWYLRMADYITVDRGDKESKEIMMLESYKVLQKGISLMIFPEGTRSTDGRIGFFKRGAFQLAISADKPILPVLIDGTGGILPKHGFIFGGRHRIVIRVLDPALPGSFGTNDPDDLAMQFQKMMTGALADLKNETGRL